MTGPPSHRFTWTVPDEPAAGHIVLSCDPRTVFGRARPPVVVVVAGHAYRSTVAIMAGETFVPFRRSHRAAAGVRPGDTVAVVLTLDTAVRTAAVPADLANALSAAGLWDGWHRLSYSRQREQADGIEGAKRPDTRRRRIAATLDLLRPS